MSQTFEPNYPFNFWTKKDVSGVYLDPITVDRFAKDRIAIGVRCEGGMVISPADLEPLILALINEYKVGRSEHEQATFFIKFI